MVLGNSERMASPLSRWSARLAMFAVMVILTALFLHRIFALSTPAAFNLLAVSYLISAVAVMAGLLAAIGIWRNDTPGASRVVLGILLGGAVLASPLALALVAADFPVLNDVTTDPQNPPPYKVLANERTGWANPADYPGGGAKVQIEAYPDLQPLIVNRTVGETFDVVAEALRRQHLTIVAETPPTEEAPVGTIEAFDRTMVLGFYDDVAVRVRPDPEGARIDLRSSSRYGRTDFGRNATRLRDIMQEIVARLEATIPALDERSQPSGDARSVKRPKNEPRDPARPRRQ